MSTGKNVGVVSRLRAAFRERWVVGSEYDPYMPTTPNSTAKNAAQSQPIYRYPSPADQPKAKLPVVYPETVYDSHLWKRKSLTFKAPANADQGEFDRHASPKQLGILPGDGPAHVPRPFWWGDLEAHAYRRKMYVESGGLVAVGVHRVEDDFVIVGNGARKEYNQHLTSAGRRQARAQKHRELTGQSQ